MAAPMFSELYSCLREFAQQQFRNIAKEKTLCRNMPFAFTNLGDFGEELALYIYPESIGSASKGGCAFDNRTVKGDVVTAREIKTVSLNGSKKCNGCGNKAPFMQPHCVFCGGTEFRQMEDSRAGIGATAHVKYHDQLKEYLIFLVKYNIVGEFISIRGYKFDSSNQYFDKLIRNQKENGSGDTCNFIPYSYDWHMSGPMKVMDIDIYPNTAIDTKYMNFDNTVIDEIPFKNYNTGKVIFTKAELEKKALVQQMFPMNYEENIWRFDIRTKSHGRARGETKR